MRKLTALFLALLFLAAPAHALTGRVLYIVCDKLGVASNSNAFAMNNIIARVQEVQGWKYETCMSSDSNFVNTLYAINPDTLIGGVGTRYGRYDMAVVLNLPDAGFLDTDAETITYGVYHFADWIDRNSPRRFPIPLLLPWSAVTLRITGVFAEGITGQDSTNTNTTGVGEPYKDAQGDSLYMISYKNESVVFNSDSTGFEWVKPLMWRHVQGRIAQKKRMANCWMTVGEGNHRVIWMPWANYDLQAGMLATVFAMFTKVQPIELPIIAYVFGITSIGYSGGAERDTVQYDAGFKRNMDYAIANGMKVELAGYPYRMKSQGVTANTTTAISYATDFPDNIRITMSAGESWYPPNYSLMLSLTGSYSQKVNRVKYTQDSCAVYYPIINTSILDGYNGTFSESAAKADTVLMVLANRGITDVYNYWDPGRTAAYPSVTTYQVVGPQRTWINDGGTPKELRFHSINNIARYAIQEKDIADWTKIAYIDTTNLMLNRATWCGKIIPFSMGIYVYIDGGEYRVSGASAKGARAMAQAKFAAGIYLPAFTFAGGSKTSWETADHGVNLVARRALVDSTRSLFLDVMKMLNNQKKMGDYIVSTYGTTGQSPFIFSYLSDVKWDRRNGRAFANSQ